MSTTIRRPGSSPYHRRRRLPIGAAALSTLLALNTLAALGASAHRPTLHALGPYNATFLAGGIGLKRPLPGTAPLLRPGAAWSISAWVRPALHQPGTVILGGFGTVRGAHCDCLALADGRVQLHLSGGASLRTTVALPPGTWSALAATYDGQFARLYVDGHQVAVRSATPAAAPAQITLAPLGAGPHFGGSVAHWRIQGRALSAAALQHLAAAKPRVGLIEFYRVGAGWPLQKRSWRGLQHPQPAWTLPKSRETLGHWPQPPEAASRRTYPQAEPVRAQPALRHSGPGRWVLERWQLEPAPKVPVGGAVLSQDTYSTASWYPAVVPGTVLTTLVARGRYPDPYYGLNDLLIPERLARQAYWYRTAFVAPKRWDGRELTLRFDGINYAGTIWLNGKRIGTTRGAFRRGLFNVSTDIIPDRLNVLAVRVVPPPHPGIPYEKSIAAGPGNNGGHLALDGPTFIATEGWDWMPPVRDRDTGLWQQVVIHSSGKLLLHAPHVVTHLPLPKLNRADVSIGVSLENRHRHAVPATLVASFGGITVRDTVRLPPGTTRIHLTPASFPALRVRHPHLWWPNGYGAPYLYRLTLRVYDDALPSGRRRAADERTLHFGIREISYELSLFGRRGQLRRVVVDPTVGRLDGTGPLIDVRHRAINRTPNGWAASLTRAAQHSPAVRPVGDTSLAPYLVIRVNGVRIAARGGSWGTDDAMKRISRKRLTPYFRLTRQANLDIIRNWLGQDTEPSFYRLADRYGLLVLNDFWESTQNFQLQAENPQLFLANARDVIERYRNHPSIAVWFGRNEGVPQPIINDGLARLIETLDGTRLYLPSSNRVNLQGSGPYDYRPPRQYFTRLARGFSVEVGTPSLASLRSLKAMMPRADLWPPSDTWAYHDWNFGGNGDVRVFMRALNRELGTPHSLEGFERRAQLMDYVSYRAIFEGFNAGLWQRNSGRLLWMTQPAWPSNIWQIYTSDYATAGAYYGVKEACQPLHVQMNLPDFALAVVNTTRTAQPDLTVQVRIVSLHGRRLAQQQLPVSAAANAVTTLRALPLQRWLRGRPLVFVQLRLANRTGRALSENVYWQGAHSKSLRALDTLRAQPVAVTAQRSDSHATGGARHYTVTLTNRGTEPAVALEVTALDAHGQRVLPSYYSTNFLTLMPGEHRQIRIRCPRQGARCARVQLQGWNALGTSVPIEHGH